MTAPVLTSVSPSSGPVSGGALARLVGTGFGQSVSVRIGGRPAVVLAVRQDAGASIVDIRTPAHEPGHVSVEISNLDSAGVAIPGESTSLADAYRFERENLARESMLTRLVRHLLRELKRQVVADVSASVSVDYDDTPADETSVIAMATLPSLVLSGPMLRENRFYSTNVIRENVVAGVVVRHRPPLTFDLAFTLTGASERAAELFNMMAALATFFSRNRWLELPRDPDDALQGVVRWEMAPDGECRSTLDGRNDVRAFSWGLVVRGVDVDEGLPFDVTGIVAEPELDTTQHTAGEA